MHLCKNKHHCCGVCFTYRLGAARLLLAFSYLTIGDLEPQSLATKHFVSFFHQTFLTATSVNQCNVWLIFYSITTKYTNTRLSILFCFIGGSGRSPSSGVAPWVRCYLTHTGCCATLSGITLVRSSTWGGAFILRTLIQKRKIDSNKQIKRVKAFQRGMQPPAPSILLQKHWFN